MNSTWLLTAVTVLSAPVASAEPAQPRDPGAKVRELFVAKCSVCHGPDLVKPKGRFGYVLDLQRVASNPEFVIPGRPDESELWVLVRRGEMPPPDSPQGPLTAGQKELVRNWIAAGAPDVPAQSIAPLPGDPPTTGAEPTAIEASWFDRRLRWIGRFHLLLLHFPIALVIAAGVAECRSAWLRDPHPSEVVRFCLWLAALASIPTTTMGWLFALDGHGAGSPQLLAVHRWLGTAAAGLLLLAAIRTELDARRAARTWPARMLLFAAILVTAITAHFGGLLAHGDDFFTW